MEKLNSSIKPIISIISTHNYIPRISMSLVITLRQIHEGMKHAGLVVSTVSAVAIHPGFWRLCKRAWTSIMLALNFGTIFYMS